MTAVDLHDEIAERLGAGDDVVASETLKTKATAVIDELFAAGHPSFSPRQPPDEVVAAVLTPVDAAAEEVLAVLLPIVEYGSTSSLNAIPQSLLHVARRTSLITREGGWRQIVGVLLVGRFAWALTAYALHCNRLEAVTAAWRAVPPPRHGDEVLAPLLADRSLRHVDIYDGHAGRAYSDYYSWLSGSELIQTRYPIFAAELEHLFPEADFLLALRAEGVHGSGLYSHGFTREVVARFRARLSDGDMRTSLSNLFGVSLNDLNATLARAYGTLKTDQNRWDQPPTELFPNESDR